MTDDVDGWVYLDGPEPASLRRELAALREAMSERAPDRVGMRRRFLARLGVGVARAPRYVVAADVRAGRLVEVLPGFTTTPRKVHSLHPAGRRLPARVRVFLDHIALALRGLDLDSLQDRPAP